MTRVISTPKFDCEFKLCEVNKYNSNGSKQICFIFVQRFFFLFKPAAVARQTELRWEWSVMNLGPLRDPGCRPCTASKHWNVRAMYAERA